MRPLDPRIRRLLEPGRAGLTLALVASLAAGLLTIVQAVALGTMVVRLVGAAGEGAGDWVPSAVVFGGAVALRALANYLVDVGTVRASDRIALSLRRRILAAVLGLRGPERDRQRIGELTVLATRGIAAIQPWLTKYLPALVTAAVLPVATVATIAWLDPLSGLVVVLTLPLVPVFAVLIGMATRDRADREWRSLMQLSGHFLDVVRGLPTLVAFRRADAQAGRIRQITDRYRRASLDTLKLAFSSSVVLELVATLSVALVAVVVGLRLAGGGLDFRTALVVLLLAPEAYWPLRRVGAEFHAAADGVAAFEQVDTLFSEVARADAEHTARAGMDADRADAPGGGSPTAPTPVAVAARSDHRALEGVELDSVRLRWPGRTRPVLSDLSLTLPSTGLIAIAGPSGCGKSTLLDALLGDLDLDAGTATVRGAGAPEHGSSRWRSLFAWSAQRPWLRPGSIADNLRVARPQADDQQLWSVLEIVGLTDAIAALPDSLQTPLGADGAGLSAGQRARLALARVILSDRPILLLDEPSAHLDPRTESIILDTLRAQARHRLVVVVAHSEAVIEAADRVVALPAPDLDETPLSEAPATAPAPARDPGPETDEPIDDRRLRRNRRLGVIFGVLSSASGVALTATAAWLITKAASGPPVLYLMVAIVGVRLFGLARPVLRYVERLLSHDAALRMLAERRAAVYDALVPLVPGRLPQHHRGELLTTLVDDVDAYVDHELRVRQPRWTALLVLVGAVAYATWVHPAAGLILAITGLVAAVADPFARRAVARSEQGSLRGRGRIAAVVQQSAADAKELLTWQQQDGALDELDAAGREQSRWDDRSSRSVALARLLVMLTCGAGVLTMAGWVATGSHGVGAPLQALLILLPLACLDVLAPVADAGALSARTAAADRRVSALLDAEPMVTDRPDARTTLPTTGRPAEAALEQVTAGWQPDRVALTDLSLRIPPGARIGLVGPSGSGKSTVAALLMRFLDPASGRLALAGCDLRDLRLDTVRGHVALVDDDPYLFSSNVLENVRLARPDADDDQVLTALRGAGLTPWLATLPHGPATLIGESHASVSGGERARIGIARALLADPDVLVLDEPTAHLDAATATAVTEAIFADRDRSLLWITHQRHGLDRTDRIVRLTEESRTTPGSQPHTDGQSADEREPDRVGGTRVRG